MNKIILIISLAFFWVPNLFAQENSFSLKEAIEYGYSNSLALKVAENDLKTADQQRIETRAIGLPKISAKVDYNHYLKLPISLIPANFLDPNAPADEFAEISFGTKNNLTASGTLSSLLFSGSYLVALKASNAYMDFSAQNIKVQRAKTRDNIRKAYLPPLLIMESSKTIDKNLVELNKMYTEMQEMYKEGFIEQLDLDRLALSIENLKMQKEDLANSYKIAIDGLKFQMGYPLEDPLVLKDNIDLLKSDLTPEEVTGEVNLNANANYRLLELSKGLQDLDLRRYQSEYLPTLSGFVTYQQVIQGENLFKNPNSSPISIAGLSLNIPIFDGLSKKSKIQQAKIKRANIDLQQKMVSDGINIQVSSARKSYINAQNRIKDRTKNVALAEKIFKTAQIKYQEGVGSSLEIIQAEQALLASQQNYINALYDFVVAKMDLKNALSIGE